MEHARLCRADAGERRARDLRVPLGRSRLPHFSNQTTVRGVRALRRGPARAAPFLPDPSRTTPPSQQFFTNLAAHGITKANTLFMVTVDEGDHFAGGAGLPAARRDARLRASNCSTLTACPSNQIGEVNSQPAAAPAERGAAVLVCTPTTLRPCYVNGGPGLERTAASGSSSMTWPTSRCRIPYVGNGALTPVTYRLADQAEERALHMVNAERDADADVHDLRPGRFLHHRRLQPDLRGGPLRQPGLRVESRRRAAGDRRTPGSGWPGRASRPRGSTRRRGPITRTAPLRSWPQRSEGRLPSRTGGCSRRR